MKLIDISNMTFSYEDVVIFEKVQAKVMQGAKIGVVGDNGAGKTTLFYLLQKKLSPVEGAIKFVRDLNVASLQQDMRFDPEKTIRQEALSAFSHLIDMEQKLADIRKSISMETDRAAIDSLLARMHRIQESYEQQDGYAYMSYAKGILKGLGFSENQFDLPVRALSGGQKTRFRLAKLLLDPPDLLLLDEPTNHLDMASVEWLESFLSEYKGTFMVISHDRTFLDTTVTSIFHVHDKKISGYSGNYTAFIKKRAQRMEIHAKHYETQQKEIRRQQKIIDQQKRWNRQHTLVTAHSREKMLERMERVEKPQKSASPMQVHFKDHIPKTQDVLFVDQLAKKYSEKNLFENVSFTLHREDKCFVIGPNGIGKTTLLKILAGLIPASYGTFRYADRIHFGYFDQERNDLTYDRSILDEVWKGHEKVKETDLRNLLASFLFTGDKVHQTIDSLSGGEKTRVSLIKLLMSNADVLILDEPNNHLDIASREALEDALTAYKGAVLCVTHDRYFIKKVATRILDFGEHGVRDFHFDYDTYRAWLAKQKTTAKRQMDEPSESARRYEQKKDLRRRVRKLENRVKQTESNILIVEEEIKSLKSRMENPKNASDHELLETYHMENQQKQEQLDTLYDQWEKEQEQLIMEKQQFEELDPS